ncbi:hypothetical protein QEZ52_15760 [Aliisedimentitalea scapharcae]|uniref:Transferrin-binding protein B C-lobe/N-lobe beta barrel domain-containing protein n=1 Tax=Aliisedimentitalea scapharcae TaxID=1524259 RepID=A0ABZ2XTA6_9RHOB
MKKYIVALAAGLTLSACSGGNPFVADTGTGTGTGSGGSTGGGIASDRTVPPGTQTPVPDASIFRSEPTSTDAGKSGNGYATAIAYDSATDEFSVDNLGFDGNNVYARDTTPDIVSNLPFAVYEASAQLPDSLTGTPINQLNHRAIYGVSQSGNTKFAIVRTGAYVEYGFGGFVYERDGGVVLPATGQALYTGLSQGLRDKNGTGGLQHTRADMSIAIDFDDFNDVTGTRGDAVRGNVSNRRIFDMDGNDVTDGVLGSINASLNTTMTAIPDATFVVEPGVLDDNGEILGQMNSYYVDSSGQNQVFETGNYYAVLSGTNADEVVGVFVMETTRDPSATGVRDTSGFVLVRQ